MPLHHCGWLLQRDILTPDLGWDHLQWSLGCDLATLGQKAAGRVAVCIENTPWTLELQTNLHEDFTIMEKAFYWVKGPTSAFTFETLC